MEGDATPVKAALPGTVLKVLVSAGDSIAEGDVIAVVEAMKMETEIKSPMAGTVKEVEIEGYPYYQHQLEEHRFRRVRFYGGWYCLHGKGRHGFWT